VDKRSFNAYRFKNLGYKEVFYDSLNDFNSQNVVLLTGNVAQILHLECKATKKQFLLTNTHLYWKPEAVSIKIKQVCMLMESILEYKGHRHLPVILCGGNFQSGPYNRVTNSRVDWNTSPYDILYSLLTDKVLISDKVIRHVFMDSKDHGDSAHPAALEKTLDFIPRFPQLRSCYSHYAKNYKKRKDLEDSPVREMEEKPKVHGEPPFTTYTVEWKGTLDYIFLWGDSLRVEGILDLPDPNTMEPGIPNEVYPSDHIPLIARISWDAK
jgi:hypothetical protein